MIFDLESQLMSQQENMLKLDTTNPSLLNYEKAAMMSQIYKEICESVDAYEASGSGGRRKSRPQSGPFTAINRTQDDQETTLLES